MKLTWFGHSCFKLESADGVLVFDPSENGRVPGYYYLPDNFPADKVICSHSHRDHSAEELVSLTGKEYGGKVTLVNSFHDEANGTKRGNNAIAMVETEGFKVIHMGDQGCELTDEQNELLKGADVLLIPVGGFYTIDGKTARAMADKLEAKVVIPMHYRFDDKGYGEIATIDEFLSVSENVKKYDTDSIVIDADTTPHTAVLSYLG